MPVSFPGIAYSSTPARLLRDAISTPRVTFVRAIECQAFFRRRTAISTLVFVARVLEEMPFPLQRVQTDRGQEFFAVSVQQWLIDHGIKFRPIKPASPHLNGKVARSQKADRQEFWADANPNSPELEWWLPEWQHDDNWDRPHGSLNGQTSIAM